jgi:glycosyltransferase involved in cell wall biosynthesis
MSSLSNLPYGKILDYWYEKLSGKQYRYKFLFTKIVEVFIFKSYGGNGSNRHNYFEFPEPIQNTVSENPKLCIVIPTFLTSENDLQNISNLLNSISKQALQPNEVIIIDDCSPISFSFPASVTFFRLEQNSGPAEARNIGKKLAIEHDSDIIAFTDTDCILSENWISSIVQSFLDFKDFQILSGDTSAHDKNWFGTYHNINGTLNGRQLKNSERLLYGTTANLAITKEVAANIEFNKNFPNAAGEDIEFCFKSNMQGFAIKYIPTMTVFHNFGYSGRLSKDLKLFIQKFKKYGQSEKILLQQIRNYYVYFDRTNEIPSLEYQLSNSIF